MPNLIYQHPQQRYQVDRCLPQREAIKQGRIGFHALSHGHYPGTLIPETVLPGISSIGFFDAIAEQNWGTEEHRNEGIEICFQETGASVLFADGIHHAMPAGTVSITRPWQLHRQGDPFLGPGRLHWIIIDVGVRRPSQNWTWPDWCILTAADLDELTATLRGNEHPVWAANREIMQVFGQFGTYLASADPARFASQIMVALNQLLLALLDLLRKQHIEPDQHLTSRRRTAELFLRELQRNPRMQHKVWTLDEMAAHCGMGRTAFAGYCHEITNTTPIEYLNRCRLESAAKRIVRETHTPITTIALDAGFSSSQYFCRKFKERYGTTPQKSRPPASRTG